MAGLFVFHVQKVSGVFNADKLAVADRVCELPCVIGGGVFVPFAIDEQHRYFNALCGLEIALRVAAQHLVDVKVHLRVFVFGQGADVPVVEALEQ